MSKLTSAPCTVTDLVTGVYPTNENITWYVPFESDTEKLPLASESVPFEELATVTETPEMAAPFASFTEPFTTPWAKRAAEKNNKSMANNDLSKCCLIEE
jgi:hypothetical protein